jgi:hypothetical protein
MDRLDPLGPGDLQQRARPGHRAVRRSSVTTPSPSTFALCPGCRGATPVRPPRYGSVRASLRRDGRALDVCAGRPRVQEQQLDTSTRSRVGLFSGENARLRHWSAKAHKERHRTVQGAIPRRCNRLEAARSGCVGGSGRIHRPGVAPAESTGLGWLRPNPQARGWPRRHVRTTATRYYRRGVTRKGRDRSFPVVTSALREAPRRRVARAPSRVPNARPPHANEPGPARGHEARQQW